jgi:hypothetical protein
MTVNSDDINALFIQDVVTLWNCVLMRHKGLITSFIIYMECYKFNIYIYENSLASVRERTIPTEC